MPAKLHKPPVAAVFGASKAEPGEPAWQIAYQLGRSLGSAGFTVANGGYGGTMAASARGAREAGAHTIGVTCDVFGRSGPNTHIVEEIRTADLMQRLDTLVGLGDCYFALPGLTGTLVELALAWELVAKRMLPERPIVCVGDFWRPVVDAMVRAGARRGVWLSVAADVPAAVEAVRALK